MSDLFSPSHRKWLIRGGVAIAVVCAVAIWLAVRTDTPPVIAPGGEAQKASHVTTASEIAEIARRATVLVVATGRRGEVVGQGTGFFLSADGLVATNYHVIKGARALRIQTLDGNPTAEVYLVATDTTRDLAMLRVERPNGSYLRITARHTLATGDPVYVMGNPLGQVGTFSTGVVSATRMLDGMELVQITAPISPGSSGGPVLNDAGEVIGVATLNLSDGQNMNFAVSARYLVAMMAEKDSAVIFTEAARISAATHERHNDQPAPTGSAEAEPSTEAYSAEIDPQFVVGDSIVRLMGYLPESRIVGDYLGEGEVKSHPVNINRAGTYLIQAHCDNACSQLGLSIRDTDDEVVDTDRGTDHAVLIFDASSPGRYVMRITMRSCSVSQCAYGVRLYPAMPPRSP